MGRNTGFLASIDAFGKTMEDVKIKTRTGALLTMLSLSLILSLTFLEFVDYRRIHLEPSLVVDKSRGERLSVDLNVTFPRVPCYLLSIDLMDISGEHQNDLTHNIEKTRLDKDGGIVDLHSTNLQGDLERVAAVRGKDYCGSCYGGVPPANGCCNNCDEVREAYVRKGWSFTNPDGIEQCVEEHWSEKIASQNTEGCNVAGAIHVNKVPGAFHFSPGRSFQQNAVHVHDLVPYLKSGNHHDFGHRIHRFSFGPEGADKPTKKMIDVKRKLKIHDPLENVRAHTEESQYMFQYFVKVVATQYHALTGDITPSHQYSVTSYERDLTSHDQGKKDAQGHTASHGSAGIPGVFFNYEISPMLVIHTEERQSFAHFITSTMAIVGGVLTVFQIIDSAIFSGRRVLTKSGKESEGYGGLNGKLL